jgi:hypothetical protein
MYFLKLLIVLLFISCGLNEKEVVTGPGTTTTSFGSIQGDISFKGTSLAKIKVELYEENNLNFNRLKVLELDGSTKFQFDSLKLGRYLIFAYNEVKIQSTQILEVTENNLDINNSIQLEDFESIGFEKPENMESFYSLDTRVEKVDFENKINTYALSNETRVWAQFKNQDKEEYLIEVIADTLILKSITNPLNEFKYECTKGYSIYTQ